MLVRPAPRLGAPAAETDVPFPGPPAAPPRRRLAWVAVALPAVGGVLMAWLLHTPDVPVLRAAEPGDGPGHVALRALVGAAHRAPGRRGARGWPCSPRRRRSPMRWPPTSGRPRRPTRTSPHSLAAARRRTHLLWTRSPRGRRRPHGPRGQRPGDHAGDPGRGGRLPRPGRRRAPAGHRRPARHRRARGGRPAGTRARRARRGGRAGDRAPRAGRRRAAPADRRGTPARLGLGPLAAPSGAEQRCTSARPTRRSRRTTRT